MAQHTIINGIDYGPLAPLVGTCYGDAGRTDENSLRRAD